VPVFASARVSAKPARPAQRQGNIRLIAERALAAQRSIKEDISSKNEERCLDIANRRRAIKALSGQQFLKD
jgi:hypothetical protein